VSNYRFGRLERPLELGKVRTDFARYLLVRA
jgi:hypothetical protein